MRSVKPSRRASRNVTAALFLATACVAYLSPQSADARRNRGSVWSVEESADPITGVRRCVVTAFDRAASTSFSRTGYLYPIVEFNSEFGLLVGVSSGGRIRLPSGDIVWRVDQRDFRELRAADNPVAEQVEAPEPSQDLTAYQMRLIQAATATATVASGDRAREMLDEMIGGSSLIFRSGAAAPAYGLPSDQTNRVGQATSDGLRPYPLDQSFRDGLAQCGISEAAAMAAEVPQ